jgi:hypothetical protein
MKTFHCNQQGSRTLNYPALLMNAIPSRHQVRLHEEYHFPVMEIMFTLAQAKTDCTLTPKKQGNHTFLIISVIENASMHV